MSFIGQVHRLSGGWTDWWHLIWAGKLGASWVYTKIIIERTLWLKANMAEAPKYMIELVTNIAVLPEW